MKFKKSIITLFCVAAAALFAEGNLVRNSSFSTGFAPWQKCAWNNKPGQAVVENGTLKITQDNFGQRTNIVQSVKLKPATAYRITFRMKCADVLSAPRGGGAKIYLLLNNQKTVFQGAATGLFKDAVGTFDWKKGEFSFTTPKESGRYELYLQMMWATGKVWFDDICIFEGKPHTKKKHSLRLYPAKFQENSLNLVADLPQTLLGEFFALPEEAAGMKLEIDLPADIRFIGSSPWWWNDQGKFEPDPVQEHKIILRGKEYKRYVVTLDKKLLKALRKDSLHWNNVLRISIAARRDTKDGTGYFRLVSPKAGKSDDVTVRFKILPPLQKFEPSRRFVLGITELYNLTSPFPEVRNASLNLLFSLSRRPLTNSIFAWGKLDEKQRRQIVDRTYFVMMFGDSGLSAWRKQSNWQKFKLDEGNGPLDGICPTHAAEDPDSPYWQKFWLDLLRRRVGMAHRVDCIEWDVEPMRVCRCSLCRDRFSRELKLNRTVSVTETKGKYSAVYFRFRVRQNGRMIRNWAKLARKNFPGIQIGVVTDNLHAAPPHVSSWCGVDIRQFDDVFDVMRNMPYYCGVSYFDDFSFNVNILKTPQFPLNDPSENLEQCYIRYTPKGLLMNMVATAALGGKGFVIYPSEIMDGAYYHALQQSTVLISRGEDYYAGKGKLTSAEPKNCHTVVKLERNGEKRVAMIPDLKSYLRVLSHEIPEKGKLLTIFNYSASDRMILEIPPQGKCYAVRDLATGEHFEGADGTKPFLAALEPESIRQLEFSARKIPSGPKRITQSELQKELKRALAAGKYAQLNSQRSGKFYAGWGVSRSGAAVAELSDGVTSICYAPQKNGAVVSWRRGTKDIVENSIGNGMLDDWLFHSVNETILWRVSRFSAGPDKAEAVLEAELPPPKNADPNAVSLQGIRLKKTVSLKNGRLICRGEIFNPKSYPVKLAFRIRNYPQLSLPWQIISGKVKYSGVDTQVTALKKGRKIPFAGRCLNNDYDGAPFRIMTPDGCFAVQAPSADGVFVWTSDNSPSTVEPCFLQSELAPGKKFTFETRSDWLPR